MATLHGEVALTPRNAHLRHRCARQSRVPFGKQPLLTLHNSRNCVKHSRDCNYGPTPGNGGKTDPSQRSNSSNDEAVSADDTVTLNASGSERNADIKTAAVTAPTSAVSYHALPITQHRLFYHMSSIAESIEASQASNVAIYMKRLPT
jgi:hypothetical protein